MFSHLHPRFFSSETSDFQTRSPPAASLRPFSCLPHKTNKKLPPKAPKLPKIRNSPAKRQNSSSRRRFLRKIAPCPPQMTTQFACPRNFCPHSDFRPARISSNSWRDRASDDSGEKFYCAADERLRGMASTQKCPGNIFEKFKKIQKSQKKNKNSKNYF